MYYKIRPEAQRLSPIIGHALNQYLQLKRVDQSKRLLSRYAGERQRNILFTDENFFTIEEHYNKLKVLLFISAFTNKIA